MAEYVASTWATTDYIYSAQATAISAKVDDIEVDNTIQSARMDQLAAGVNPVPRFLGFGTGVGLAGSGVMVLSYFTAHQAVSSAANVYVRSGATAAGATPTLVRWGLYSVAGNGDLTLVASIANSTNLFAATNTGYTRSISTPYSLTAGQRYASAWLIVTSAAMPTIIGPGPAVGAAELAIAPRLTGQVSGQTDLPSSVSAGSVADSAVSPIYTRIYP